MVPHLSEVRVVVPDEKLPIGFRAFGSCADIFFVMKHRKTGVAGPQYLQYLETFCSCKLFSHKNPSDKDTREEPVSNNKNMIFRSLLEIQKSRVDACFQILEILLVRMPEVRLTETKECLPDIRDLRIIYWTSPQLGHDASFNEQVGILHGLAHSRCNYLSGRFCACERTCNNHFGGKLRDAFSDKLSLLTTLFSERRIFRLKNI